MSNETDSRTAAGGEASLSTWLRTAGTGLRERVLEIGRLTGLKHDEDGAYRAANFERGLLLDRIMETRRPARALELGTGRGLGSLLLSDSAARHGVAGFSLTTVDFLAPDAVQAWPRETPDEGCVNAPASRRDIWTRYFPAPLLAPVHEATGPTETVLPRLLREGASFDFIFIDAGHNLFSVIHDLAYSMALLAPGGCILMDDFAPLEAFGLGTCVATAHAARSFRTIEIIETEGVVFGGAVHAQFPRRMVFLADALAARPNRKISRARLAAWRVLSGLLDFCYRPGMFPLTDGR